ncbi:hypothetical protein KSZ_32750 [Dictyobacter formicarum]|uniref:Uncharacterized protein n=1 Tax=Dictyobacter formicarum TaxID=2778368 RepID=A0ABQ3VHU9_9CHLR|nr:hypothetical protein KSZ_32750 [Dictyobacter formicarum]
MDDNRITALGFSKHVGGSIYHYVGITTYLWLHASALHVITVDDKADNYE